MLGIGVGLGQASQRLGRKAAAGGLLSELGDSRAPWVLDGATARQKGGTDLMNIVAALEFQRMRTVGAYGVSGKRADEFISAGHATVLALSPNIVFYPSVLNTIGQDYPTQGTSGAQAASDIITSATADIAAGAYAVIKSEVGQAGMADVRRDQVDIYNHLVRQFCAITPGALFVDTRPSMCDANRKLLAAYTYDNTHNNGLGALREARIVKAALDTIVNATVDWRLQANGLPSGIANQVQVLTNPLFNTTTGGSTSTGATGTFAGSCTFNKTGASAALAVASAAQNVVLTGTFGAQSDNVRMSQTANNANWASGDKLRALALINIANPVNLAGVQLAMVATGDSVATTYADLSATATWAGQDDSADMLLMTQEYTIAAYTVKNSLVATVQANAFGAGGVTLTVKQLGILKNTG